jgi:acyl-coenzyme A thioesterase PaaI-like protein
MAQNRLSRIIGSLGRLPAPLRRRAVSLVMRRMVPFVGTADLRIQEMTEERVVVFAPNRRSNRNHIRSLHAGVMALAAETATGFVVAMNTPSESVPVIKSLKVEYRKRCQGSLRLEASLTAEQRERIRTQPKGDVPVAVTAVDGSGNQPIVCEMIWAWVPKNRGVRP